MEHDDGFSFGIGAFETMLVMDGRCVMFGRHMERLRSALEVLGVGNRIDPAGIEAAVADGHLDGRVLKVEVSERNVILSDRAVPYSEGDYVRGFRIRLSAVRRNETSPFTYIKSLQYGDSIMEKRRAVAEGFDEPLFLNGRGEICEGATTNIFFAEGDRLFTPAVGCGLLPGTVRAYVIERFGADEGVFRPEDLDRFDGCFVTNSVLGVMPVASLGDMVFRDRTVCSEVRMTYQEDLHRGLRRWSRFVIIYITLYVFKEGLNTTSL